MEQQHHFDKNEKIVFSGSVFPITTSRLTIGKTYCVSQLSGNNFIFIIDDQNINCGYGVSYSFCSLKEYRKQKIQKLI